MRQRLSNFFRRLGGTWVSGDEAWMSPAERAFIEERQEDRFADQIVAGTLGGFPPDRVLDFPDDHGRFR
jgi:hypothetical protein